MRVKTSAAVRLAVSAALGIVVGFVFSLFNSRYTGWEPAILVGWDVAVAFLIGTLFFALHASTPGETKENALREDPSLPLSELIVLTAGVAVLAAVGLLLDRAGQATGGNQGVSDLPRRGERRPLVGPGPRHLHPALRPGATTANPRAGLTSTKTTRRTTSTSPTWPSPSA